MLAILGLIGTVTLATMAGCWLAAAVSAVEDDE